LAHSYRQDRVFHDDGTWSDVSTVEFAADTLRFKDIVLEDYETRIKDIAHLRYVKAILRGETNPIIVVWACLEQDKLCKDLFPTLNTITDEGEHLLSANSLINYSMRQMLERHWLFYDKTWQLRIPPQETIWHERASMILEWLIEHNRISLETDHDPTRQDFMDFDVYTNAIPVGCCGFLQREVQKQGYQVAFNSSYFLLEHDDFLSHHSALGDAYNLHVSGGEIMRPPLYCRSAIWRDTNSNWYIDRIGMQDVELRLGENLILSPETDFTVNPKSTRSIAIYTRYFGVENQGYVSGYTPQSDNCIEFTVIDRKIVSWQSGGHLQIPQNGFVLSFAPPYLNEDQLTRILASPEIAYRLSGRFQHIVEAIQCGPRLLNDNELALHTKIFDDESFWVSRESDGQRIVGVVPTDYPIDIDSVRAGRVGIGIKATGNLVVVAASGVNSGYHLNNTDSMGATLIELARYLQAAGAINAVNLDGGGSTQLFFNGGTLTRAGDRRGFPGIVFDRMIPSIGVVV